MPEIKIDLETECPCKYEGWVHKGEDHPKTDCRYCRGCGFKPTPFGFELIEFFKKFRHLLEDES